MDLSLEPTVDAKRKSVELWRERASKSTVSVKEQPWNIINLAQSLQSQGEHLKALDLLESVGPMLEYSEDWLLQIWARALAGKSLTALGRNTMATDLFKESLALIEHVSIPPEAEGSILLEAGKGFRTAGDTTRAQECWTKAAKLFAGNPAWKASYARAVANLGLILLDDPDPAKQEEGVRTLETASDMKVVMNDVEGLANDYGNLGMHYWRKKRYGRAIAFLRKDLALSRQVGDDAALAMTLNNLAIVYQGASQLSPARRLLREARQIVARLDDTKLLAITDRHLAEVDRRGKQAGLNGEKIGPTAACACGSGKEFQVCCGRADFEPVEAPFTFMGISQDLEEINQKVRESGRKPWLLDRLLRHTEEAKRRMAWNEVESHDGWLSWREVADMSNLHLSSAQSLADTAQADAHSLAHPLGCIILSVCALEAFINQTAYFAASMATNALPEFPTFPAELIANVQEYQRRTELTLKWLAIGKVLCGEGWPPEPLWTEFRDLVFIRNEVVHSKVNEFEQTIPRPKTEHEVLQRIPKEVDTRNVPRSWPFRILTPSVAKWAASVADALIVAFRKGYNERFLSASHPT
jgi:tetratricopeptide (TPR) repeat protein